MARIDLLRRAAQGSRKAVGVAVELAAVIVDGSCVLST
jgi:hypothetical protein